MATAAQTVTDISGDSSILTASWTLTSTNVDGAPFVQPAFTDVTWTAVGTWGGATLTYQGSNDGTNWFSLSDATSGSATALTANGMSYTLELPLYKRPYLSTAGSGASLVVTALIRKNPLR